MIKVFHARIAPSLTSSHTPSLKALFFPAKRSLSGSYSKGGATAIAPGDSRKQLIYKFSFEMCLPVLLSNSACKLAPKAPLKVPSGSLKLCSQGSFQGSLRPTKVIFKVPWGHLNMCSPSSSQCS